MALKVDQMNTTTDLSVSQFSSCKWYPVFRVLVYFVSVALCKSSGLIATSMHVNTIQFYLHPFVSVFL